MIHGFPFSLMPETHKQMLSTSKPSSCPQLLLLLYYEYNLQVKAMKFFSLVVALATLVSASEDCGILECDGQGQVGCPDGWSCNWKPNDKNQCQLRVCCSNSGNCKYFDWK